MIFLVKKRGEEVCNQGPNKGNTLEWTLTVSIWSVALLNEKITYFRINCRCNSHKIKERKSLVCWSYFGNQFARLHVWQFKSMELIGHDCDVVWVHGPTKLIYRFYPWKKCCQDGVIGVLFCNELTNMSTSCHWDYKPWSVPL